MKRKKIIAGLVFVMVFGLVGLSRAGAQESSLRTRTQEVVENTREARLGRLQGNITRLLTHFRAVTARIDGITTRLNSHLAKLEAEGKDVSTAKGLLQEAGAALTKAKETIQGIEAKVAAAATATDIRPGFKGVREELNQAREAVQMARQKLMEAIKLLRAL